MRKNLLKLAAPRVGRETLLVVDLTDISKQYAQKIKETSSGEKVYDLEFGARKVGLPGRTEPLTLVVVDGLGQNPLMLLTNRRVTRSRKSQWRIVKSYSSRWRVEETIRFIKQSYRLEEI